MSKLPLLYDDFPLLTDDGTGKLVPAICEEDGNLVDICCFDIPACSTPLIDGFYYRASTVSITFGLTEDPNITLPFYFGFKPASDPQEVETVYFQWTAQVIVEKYTSEYPNSGSSLGRVTFNLSGPLLARSTASTIDPSVDPGQEDRKWWYIPTYDFVGGTLTVDNYFFSNPSLDETDFEDVIPDFNNFSVYVEDNAEHWSEIIDIDDFRTFETDIFQNRELQSEDDTFRYYKYIEKIFPDYFSLGASSKLIQETRNYDLSYRKQITSAEGLLPSGFTDRRYKENKLYTYNLPILSNFPRTAKVVIGATALRDQHNIFLDLNSQNAAHIGIRHLGGTSCPTSLVTKNLPPAMTVEFGGYSVSYDNNYFNDRLDTIRNTWEQFNTGTIAKSRFENVRKATNTALREEINVFANYGEIVTKAQERFEKIKFYQELLNSTVTYYVKDVLASADNVGYSDFEYIGKIPGYPFLSKLTIRVVLGNYEDTPYFQFLRLQREIFFDQRLQGDTSWPLETRYPKDYGVTETFLLGAVRVNLEPYTGKVVQSTNVNGDFFLATDPNDLKPYMRRASLQAPGRFYNGQITFESTIPQYHGEDYVPNMFRVNILQIPVSVNFSGGGVQ